MKTRFLTLLLAAALLFALTACDSSYSGGYIPEGPSSDDAGPSYPGSNFWYTAGPDDGAGNDSQGGGDPGGDGIIPWDDDGGYGGPDEEGGGHFSPLTVNNPPPVKDIACRACDGTKQRNCDYCGGTGKNPNAMDDSLFQNPAGFGDPSLSIDMSGLLGLNAMCVMCRGSGKVYCENILSDEDWTGLCKNGTERNLDFNWYVSVLDDVAAQTGSTIFELAPGYGESYVGIKLCSRCNGLFIFESPASEMPGYISFDTLVSVPFSSYCDIVSYCGECYAGQTVYFPSSINDVQPFISAAEISASINSAMREVLESGPIYKDHSDELPWVSPPERKAIAREIYVPDLVGDSLPCPLCGYWSYYVSSIGKCYSCLRDG